MGAASAGEDAPVEPVGAASAGEDAATETTEPAVVPTLSARRRKNHAPTPEPSGIAEVAPRPARSRKEKREVVGKRARWRGGPRGAEREEQEAARAREKARVLAEAAARAGQEQERARAVARERAERREAARAEVTLEEGSKAKSATRDVPAAPKRGAMLVGGAEAVPRRGAERSSTKASRGAARAEPPHAHGPTTGSISTVTTSRWSLRPIALALAIVVALVGLTLALRS